MKKITELAIAFATMRVRATVLEWELEKAVRNELAAPTHGSLRDMAKRMGFSAQYICDVRKGRRKISKTFLEKMVRLENKKK